MRSWNSLDIKPLRKSSGWQEVPTIFDIYYLSKGGDLNAKILWYLLANFRFHRSNQQSSFIVFN